MDPAECEIIRGEAGVTDKLFKVVLIGSASVGKSCILLRAGKDEFKDAYNVTVGTDMCNLTVRVKTATVALQIWDTAGMEQFRSVIKVFFNGAHAVLLVYDITRKDTFDVLDMWLQMIRDSASPDVKVVLIGNKADDAENRQVSSELGKQYTGQNGLFEFVETSAKTGEGILPIFKRLAMELYIESLSKASGASGRKLVSGKKGKKEGCC